jgi:hypothetical protein
MMLTRRLLGSLSLLALTLPHVARAADKTECDAAYDQAQTFRDGKKLVEAREQLRVCARATCPQSMVRDCTAWLADVERAIPSVVLVATDASGNALPNVKVSIDGAPPRVLDGTSWDVEPGPHTFAFEGGGGTRVEKQVLAVQGTKDQRVVIALVAPPVVVAPAPEAPPPSAGPWKPVGYTMLGVGAAGLVVGGVFGAVALSTKSKDCLGDLCNPGTSSTALAQGNVSTAGFVAGGVLAAAGITILLVAPKPKEQTGQLLALPIAGGGTTGLVLRGSF